MGSRNQSYSGMLTTVFVSALIGSLVVFTASFGHLAGAIPAAILYALIALWAAHYELRRSSVAIEMSGSGLGPWLSFMSLASIFAFGAIAVATIVGGALAALGPIFLIAALAGLGKMPDLASFVVADNARDQSFTRLRNGGSAGPKTTSAQGHRINHGHSATSPGQSQPQSMKSKMRSFFRAEVKSKPLAPSPLDKVIGDRDFLK